MADKQEATSEMRFKEIPTPLQSLIGGIEELYHTQEFSDLTIKCEADNSEWKVHKAIVCAQSDALKKTLLRGAQLEEKSDKNVITLDDDPQIIEAMLKYFYAWDYGDHGNRQEHVAPIVMDVRVFTIADKSFIKPLGDLAATKFSRRSQDEWDHSAFSEAIKEVYLNGPGHDDRLKRTIINTVEKNAAVLFGQAKLDEHAAFHAVLREIADFSADVSQMLASKLPVRKSGIQNEV